MKVFLLKDVPQVGMANEIIKVTDGYAHNFLFPRKLAIEVTAENEQSFAKRTKIIEKRNEVIATQTSMLAEKIKSLQLTIKHKAHDDGKLYGSVNPAEIVDLLAAQGVKVAKNQIIFDKSIKAKGTYEVTVKLSARLQPKVTLQVLTIA